MQTCDPPCNWLSSVKNQVRATNGTNEQQNEKNWSEMLIGLGPDWMWQNGNSVRGTSRRRSRTNKTRGGKRARDRFISNEVGHASSCPSCSGANILGFIAKQVKRRIFSSKHDSTHFKPREGNGLSKRRLRRSRKRKPARRRRVGRLQRGHSRGLVVAVVVVVDSMGQEQTSEEESVERIAGNIDCESRFPAYVMVKILYGTTSCITFKLQAFLAAPAMTLFANSTYLRNSSPCIHSCVLLRLSSRRNNFGELLCRTDRHSGGPQLNWTR